MNLSHTAYLLTGSNLGDREENLSLALSVLGDVFHINAVSPVYETDPWGFSTGHKFLNQAVKLETFLDPYGLLRVLHSIEARYGRTRNAAAYTSRTLDIDLLYFDDLITDSDSLRLPHPLLHERRFALVPLCDIAPGFIHPLLNKTNQQLLAECKDTLGVYLLNSLSKPLA